MVSQGLHECVHSSDVNETTPVFGLYVIQISVSVFNFLFLRSCAVWY